MQKTSVNTPTSNLQMDYARSVGVNCRLVYWLVQYAPDGSSRDVSLRQIFKDRPLFTFDPQHPGIFEIVRDSLELASKTPDYFIDEAPIPGTVPAPFIHPLTKGSALQYFRRYTDSDSFASGEYNLKMPDLFLGKAVSPQLRNLLIQLAEMGIYWPSSHARPESDLECYQILLDENTWNVPLLEAGGDLTLGEVTYRQLFNLPLRDISAEARGNLKALKVLGITHPHPDRPHKASPRDPHTISVA